MLWSRRVSLPLVVALAVLATPASGEAATQIGQTFVPADCDGDDVLLQTSSPGGQYTVPSDGVITSWSYQGGTFPAQLRLKLARPAGSNLFTIVGESPLETAPTSQLSTFPVRIPVQAGDVLGFYLASGQCRFPPPSPPGYSYAFYTGMGDVPAGTTAEFLPGGPLQLDIAAILEPDCDGDGFGDETQDPNLFGGACPARGRAITLDANKNKVKKGKKVTLSGQLTELVRQGECQANQTVELERKRPSQSAFTTLEQLQTDAVGAFSAKEKVKKTFEYQAQVPEAGGCGGQTSNTEKVKVKKPK
jgi:hypothetical protein